MDSQSSSYKTIVEFKAYKHPWEFKVTRMISKYWIILVK